jgi:hypothetical protein
VREGMADVYVALKQLKRTGTSRPKGLTGEALHNTLMSMARQYPENVKVFTS